MSDPNLEINPYTNRQVKKCGENEERIPIENGDWKTFKCYKRCHPNQMRNMRTMRCRKQKQDYELYPSPSSVRGSNEMRKTKKNRSSTVNYNLYPSPSSVRGSNDLRKPTKNKSSSTINYNLYPSPSSVRGSNDLRKPPKNKKSRSPSSSTVDYNLYPLPPAHKSKSLSTKTRKQLKIDAIRSRKTLQKGRQWFWEHNPNKKK